MATPVRVVRYYTHEDDPERIVNLLVRARNVILVELRREAFDKPPEPSPLLLEIDEALGISNHTAYADTALARDG